jgi:hypothetical protein
VTGASSAGIPGPTVPAPARASGRLPRRWRNLLLTVHIVVAVGALGTDAILLTLGVTGLVSGDGELVRAAYLAMDLLVAVVLVPLALAALGTGVLLGLGTRWGWCATGGCGQAHPHHRAGHRRGARAATLAQRGRGQRAGAADGGAGRRRDRAGRGQGGHGAGGGVLLLTTAVALAVSKPRGRTRFRRH